MNTPICVDVLCVGHASYDLIFSVPYHPNADEKIFASAFYQCGGGPAANAAVTVARLGFRAAFAGYLGQDFYGDQHLQEFIVDQVNTELVIRDTNPTPVSSILIKPDGLRALINYKGNTQVLAETAINFARIQPKVVLFDGHEPHVSMTLVKQLVTKSIPTVLDAGSLHIGTETLMDKVDYLVCSEKFACQIAATPAQALTQLATAAPYVVITLGEQGLIWQCGQERGQLSAFSITAIDTTGAGDAFHGAFAAAVAAKMEWLNILRYASAAGALCCTKIGARPGIPSYAEQQALFASADKLAVHSTSVD